MRKSKTPTSSAMERAIMAEIDDRVARQKLQAEQASGMSDLLGLDDIAAPAAVEEASASIPEPTPAKNPNLLAYIQHTAGGLAPSARFVELPEPVQAYVQKQTQFNTPDAEIAFSNAAEYFSVLENINSLVQSMPVHIPVPTGWLSEFNSAGSHIDVEDFLKNASSASRRPEMLMDLVRWACTVQRQYEGAAARAALDTVQKRGKQSDEMLRDSVGSALLHKFNTLVSLLQTSAFAGKPELLVQCLLDDWKWMQSGVAYKTPLATLDGALYDSERMLPAAFTSTGSLNEFMQLQQQQLIDEYRCSAALRDKDYASVATGYAQKHSFCRAERTAFTADSPVIVTLGYQEQLPQGAYQSGNEWLDSWRDNVALTLTLTDAGLKVQPQSLPHDALARAPVEQAVTALILLSDAGK